jgi:hypothetical protein
VIVPSQTRHITYLAMTIPSHVITSNQLHSSVRYSVGTKQLNLCHKASTLVSASKIAFIPRSQILCSQYLQCRQHTDLERNEGCTLADAPDLLLRCCAISESAYTASGFAADILIRCCELRAAFRRDSWLIARVICRGISECRTVACSSRGNEALTARSSSLEVRLLWICDVGVSSVSLLSKYRGCCWDCLILSTVIGGYFWRYRSLLICENIMLGMIRSFALTTYLPLR